MIYRTNSIRVINNFININEDKIIESFFENTAYNVMNEANIIFENKCIFCKVTESRFDE